MPWVPIDEVRWDYNEDQDLHLLLHDPGKGLLAELHMRWVHMYRADPVPADAPLSNASLLSTTELPAEPATDEEAWQVLTAALQKAT